MKKVQYFLTIILACFFLQVSQNGLTTTAFAQDKAEFNFDKLNQNPQTESDGRERSQANELMSKRSVGIEFSFLGDVITDIESNISTASCETILPTSVSLNQNETVNRLGVSVSDAGTNVITSAQVNISGRVMTSEGRPVPRARLVLTTNTGAVFNVTTNFSGYYRFAAIPSGNDYVFVVADKHYEFPIRILSIRGDLEGFDFVALIKAQ